MQRHPWPQCESAGFQAREPAKQRSFNGMKSLDFRRVASRSAGVYRVSWKRREARVELDDCAADYF